MCIRDRYCGERGNEEFSYLGDASPVRPDPAGADAAQKFAEYVYLRDNPRGPLRELWYHTAGCHSWLVVTRDTICLLYTSFVRGNVESLGADCIEKPLEEHHKAELSKLLEAAGINGAIDPGSFRRYGSARKLYHFHVDNIGSY